MRIYADHAATTKLDPAAFEAMKPYLLEEFGNASQLYSFSRAPKKALKNAREIIAGCIGAEPEEIYFTSGGTESDNWAIKESASALPGMSIVTSSIEHHAVLHACRTMEWRGSHLICLPVDSTGTIIPTTLAENIPDNIGVVSIMLANNEIGTIEPIRELANIAHQHDAIFHTDAVQAVGHVPIHVKDLKVDLLSASAHKFNGPKGIGFLYMRKGLELPALMDGGAQEKGVRAGTENIAAIVGMAEALRTSCNAMDERARHLHRLEDCLMGRLIAAGLEFLRNGAENHIPGNVSLSFKNADGEALLHRLDFMGIYVSTGSACNSTSTELSHVLKAIKVPEEYAYGTIRISLGYENTEEDVEYIADSIIKILRGKHGEEDDD